MSDQAARLLVVDDVPQNVRLLQAVLEAHGYDVISRWTFQPVGLLPTALREAGAEVRLRQYEMVLPLAQSW